MINIKNQILVSISYLIEADKLDFWEKQGSLQKQVKVLSDAEMLEGIMMCRACAWEMDFDIKNGRSIESILEEFKE